MSDSTKFSNNSISNVPSISLHSFYDQQQDESELTKKRNIVEKPMMRIPSIGLGTYKFKKGSGMAQQAVLDALSLGYRHIDTAFIYAGEQTEKEVGNALQIAMSHLSSSAPIPRSEIFLTTKQWRSYHGYDQTLECLELSLKRLQVEYVDLYLIHWPGPAYNTMSRSRDVMENSPDGAFAYAKDGHESHNIQSLRGETWRAMEDSVDNGKCKAIGVSNFTIQHLEALRKTARYWPPAVNQIELHPYDPQIELVEYCQKHGICLHCVRVTWWSRLW
jgi:diketogulonate reductase-like aldo/keto reductase